MKQFCIAFLAACLVLASQAHAGSIAYTYDSLGRVIRVVYTVGTTTTTVNYTYDAAGNRTSSVTTSP